MPAGFGDWYKVMDGEKKFKRKVCMVRSSRGGGREEWEATVGVLLLIGVETRLGTAEREVRICSLPTCLPGWSDASQGMSAGIWSCD